ncbi:MAG: DUF501 domain-containing protein, partial [Acidimicrobiia bacterium]|nr:DUF501 domain-containing protein [Acidimicrobiia bacterium]
MTVGKPDLFVGADGLQETSPAGLDVSNRRALDEVVTKLLGRRPQGGYDVAVARSDGTPVVLVNEPFLQTGRPMPTRYWLIDPGLNKAIGALESYGGVKQAEAAIDPAELRLAHDRYRRERDRQIGPDHRGPKPTGGVGGTRTGVKCLHAHYGYFLAGGEDPVGRWVHAWLRDRGQAPSDLVVRHRALSDDQLAVAAHEDAADGGRSVPTSESSWALVEIGSGALKLLADVGGGPLRRRFPVDLLPETDDQGRLSRRGRRRLSEGLGHI